MDRLQVVSGVLDHHGQVLFVRRPEGKEFPLAWELPGGKVNEGETLRQALIREYKEEVDLTIKVGRMLGSASFDPPQVSRACVVTYFEVICDDARPKMLEGQPEFHWMPQEKAEKIVLPNTTPSLPVLWKLLYPLGGALPSRTLAEFRSAYFNAWHAIDMVGRCLGHADGMSDDFIVSTFFRHWQVDHDIITISCCSGDSFDGLQEYAFPARWLTLSEKEVKVLAYEKIQKECDEQQKNLKEDRRKQYEKLKKEFDTAVASASEKIFMPVLPTVVCGKCHGEKKVADTESQEPWSAWAELPPGSDVAVKMGIVKPIPCPKCSND